MVDRIPDWFHNAILDGLQRLYCLSLARTPAAELYPATILTWVETLADGMSWEQDRDEARIAKTFRILERTRTEWPLPRNFLEALVPTGSPRIRQEPRPLSRAEAQRRIDSIRAELNRRDRQQETTNAD